MKAREQAGDRQIKKEKKGKRGKKGAEKGICADKSMDESEMKKTLPKYIPSLNIIVPFLLFLRTQRLDPKKKPAHTVKIATQTVPKIPLREDL